MSDRLPPFYALLDDRWPLPIVLPGVQLRSTRFDPALLQPGDFVLAGIQPPANILRVVAKRQTGFLAGRLCVCAALFTLNSRTQTPAVGEDYTSVWPVAISGLIAHDDRWAAALAAARGDWRGLDLNMGTLLEAERARYLHGGILTKGERLRFVDDLERRTGLLVTPAFSLRENPSEALYPLVGKRFYFEYTELLEWRIDGQARLRLLTDLSLEWRHGSELDARSVVLDERLLSLVAIGA